MKNLYNLNCKSYKEAYYILNMLPEDIKKKIPNKIQDFITENMDTNHEITYKDIYENNLLDDTNLLLAIIYKDYIATEEERIIIKAKEDSVKRNIEEEAYKKYNPNNLFIKKKRI